MMFTISSRLAFGLVAVLFVACAVPRVPDRVNLRPTPEQRFFDWTRMDFDPEVYAERRANLARRIHDAGGGVFLAPSSDGFSGGETFRQLPDFLYFTGLELPNSVLAIDSDEGHPTLFVPRTDARFENPTRGNDFPGRPLADDPKLAQLSGIADVRPYADLHAQVDLWTREERTIWIDLGRRDSLDPRRTDFIQSWSPAQALLLHLQNTYPDARVESAYPHIARVRMVKGPEEIETLRRACAITCEGIRAAAAHIRDGVDERTLEAELEAEWKRRGSQRKAFDSIVKSGPNSLWPWRILAAHYDRRNRTMHAGELVIFDVGSELNRYVSDVGRTFPVSGHFTEPQARRIRMVNAVTDAIIAAARPGVTLGDLQKIAEDAIPEAEKPHMQTGFFFGHHIGLDVGDPSLPEVALEPGMVFTVEPWYYNHAEEIAVFLEENIVITEDGAENLTGWFPRTPEELERLVRGQSPDD